MPEINENFEEGTPYLVDGELLNRYSEGLNKLKDLNIENDGLQAEIGIFELITNDLDEVKDKQGNRFAQELNPSTLDYDDIPDASGKLIIDTTNGRWFGRFIYLKEDKPIVARVWATIDTKIYNYADLTEAGNPNASDSARIESGSKTLGMQPQFAPFDKIPCIFFRQTGKMIPFMGPPEEIDYFEFSHVTKQWIEAKELTENVVVVVLEWYDPDTDFWYYWGNRKITVPIAAFGALTDDASITLNSSNAMLIKDGTKFRVKAAYHKDPASLDLLRFDVTVSFKVKLLGRFHKTNTRLFPSNGGTPGIVNSYDFEYETLGNPAEEPIASDTVGWTDFDQLFPIANTRQRWKDTPSPIQDQWPQPDVWFATSTKTGQKWHWTGEVVLQAAIKHISINENCAKIPGVDFDDLPVEPADEVDYVLAIKDDCLVKVEVAECPEEGAAASAFTTVAASTFSLVLHLDTYSIEYTATGSVVGSLPSASSAFAADTEFIIMDSGANSAANNITINCLGTDTIIDITTGQTSVVIATNGGVIRMRAISSSVWKVF